MRALRHLLISVVQNINPKKKYAAGPCWKVLTNKAQKNKREVLCKLINIRLLCALCSLSPSCADM
jgi:hypothetical protein